MNKAVKDENTNFGNHSQLISMLSQGKLRDRLEKLAAVYVVGQTTYAAGKKIWTKYQEKRQFTVAVPGDDELYPILHAWLIDQVPDADRRAIVARAGERNNYELVSDSSDDISKKPNPLRLFYDSKQIQTLVINGHSVKVQVVKPDWASVGTNTKSDWLLEMAKREERIVFTGDGEDTQAAVIKFLNKLTETLRQTNLLPRLYICSRWGEWMRRKDLPIRELNTVILRDGQKEELIVDLETFYNNEKAYNDLGVPWHRGYIFEGPPGTGKTSLVRALSTYFGLDLYYIPLSDIDDDSRLINAITNVPARTMLLLEDVDTLPAAIQRQETDNEEVKKESSSGVSMSGLLNALDGVITPHGLVTVMTTNRIESLDKALIRPGRADRVERIGELDRGQFISMMKRFLGWSTNRSSDIGWRSGVMPADVIEVLKRHLGDDEATQTAIKELMSIYPTKG